MTKTIIKKLISRYNKAIRLIEKAQDRRKIDDILDKTNTLSGICLCASGMGHLIIPDPWINSFRTNESGYWWKQPSYIQSKSGVLKNLQKRVDRMQTFLDNPPAKTKKS